MQRAGLQTREGTVLLLPPPMLVPMKTVVFVRTNRTKITVSQLIGFSASVFQNSFIVTGSFHTHTRSKECAIDDDEWNCFA